MLERLITCIAKEMNLAASKVRGTVTLLDEGNTVPFITRYRKEVTGGLDEEQIRAIEDRIQYLRNLETRKEEILTKIEEQGKLTDELRKKITEAFTLKTLEDLYLPYRVKKRTKATIAREKGLEPLARAIIDGVNTALEDLAKPYISEEKEITTQEDALRGAMDIIADIVSDDIAVRDRVRGFIEKDGRVVSKKTTKEVENENVYQDYFEYSEYFSSIPPHRILALDRGEDDGVLRIKIDIDEDHVLDTLEDLYVKNWDAPSIDYLIKSIKESYKKSVLPSITREKRKELTEMAHLHAINIFATNLRNLLMQPPLEDMIVLAIDPGYVSGCKLAVVDETGELLAYDVIYPHKPQQKLQDAKRKLVNLYKKYKFNTVSIGNGTASRETEEFIAELISENKWKVVYTIVSEAGASVYSASKVARDEFPDLDASYRGTISIGRRLLDPLAELVKIDPKSLGVGMYQHDVAQKLLEKTLHTVVESVVNHVGVDVNRASVELLSYIAGINKRCAKSIVTYRKKHKRIASREELKKVSGIGEEVFTQCAGFLRVLHGDNPLDNTAIHPESYQACGSLLGTIEESFESIVDRQSIIALKLSQLNINKIAKDIEIGVPTLRDILDNLRKPGRDPREDVPPPIFRKGVLTVDDLEPEMELDGTVRNVVDFGAFVDIGVKEDGLVHVSQMAKKFVSNPLDICKVGDVVKVKIMSVDKARNRISLTMIL